jgi:hypothetical protein
MSRVSRKSDLSPSVTKGSNGIDLGKRDVDMGRKSEPSVTSGGIGVTQEITNVGGMSVTGGVSVDISALHNSSMLSIARPQRTNIFQLVIGTVLCFK